MIKRAHEAFNRRDIDGALEALSPDVIWANGLEGGYVRGHDAVRAYWTRHWRELDPIVIPTAIALEDGRLAVTVEQAPSQPDGSMIRAGVVRHVYTVRDGLLARMDIEEL